MNKIRLSVLVAVVFISNVVIAQTVEQGKKFLYYRRFKSAKETFEKIIASNPNNIDAVYWLGQTLLVQKDSASALDLYRKMLVTNGNAPLLLVGMGELELMENKLADAKQRFETAISLTKAKDINVLNAVGSANTNTWSGDPNYAIEKLNLALQVKNFNNPSTYIILGDAYHKLGDGGNAVTSYQKALTLDPKLAEAKCRIGLIYLSQNNKDYFIPAFEESIQLDPSYGPAYYQLYTYYYYKDINKSKDYFDKYLANADSDPSNDYDKTSILYASQRYDESINVAKTFISTLGDKADPRYYKLIAYCYDAKGDSVDAKSFIDQYFAKQKPTDFVPKDYSFRAQVLSKFPGNDAEVNKSYQMAIDKDTSYENKMDLIKEASDLAKKTGNKSANAYWLGQLYSTRKVQTNTDLYNWGYSNYQAGNYKTSDSIFCGIYQTKYPNEIFGYLWCAKAKLAEDTTMESGIVVPAWEKLAQMSLTIDSVKYKATAIQTYSYLAAYYSNIKKDKPTAISYLQKVLDLDPTNADALRYIEMLKKPAKQPAAKPKTNGH